MFSTAAVALVLAGVGVSGPGAVGDPRQPETPSFQVVSDTEIIADGHTFSSWEELAAVGYHQFESNW